MSTALFRKYIDILDEDSQETVISTVSDITRLKIALQELEAVLDKYQGRINEDQKARAQNRIFEVFSPEELEALKRAGNPGTKPVDLSQMSRSEIEAIRTGTAPGAASSSTTAPGPGAASEFLSKNPTIRKILAKGRRSAIRGGAWGAGAAVAYKILTNLYDWITSKKLDNLRPGDQEIIKKNIPIIQPWTAPDKIKTLDQDLRFRLLHVVDLLGKLGMSLAAQPPVVQNEEVAPEQPAAAARPADQQLLKLLDIAYDQIAESSHMEMKQLVLNNMHLLSETEQMSVRRAIVMEVDLSWAELAAAAGGVATLPYAASKAFDWAKETVTADEKRKAAQELLAKQSEEAADQIEAAKQENIKITAQNADAERRWRASGKKGERPKPIELKPIPKMPPGLPPVPKKGLLNKTAGIALKLAYKYPKTAAIVGGLIGIAGYAATFATIAEKTVEKTLDTVNQTVKDRVAEVQTAEDLFKRAAQMTDEQLAGTLMLNPEDYLKYAKVEMKFCSGHPNYPECKKRMEQLCADPVLTDLNGGPLAGC